MASSFLILIVFKQFYLTHRLGLTSTITLDQSGTRSNGNEGDTSQFLEFHNWSIIIRHSIVSYLGHPFCGDLTPLQGIQLAYSKPPPRVSGSWVLTRENKPAHTILPFWFGLITFLMQSGQKNFKRFFFQYEYRQKTIWFSILNLSAKILSNVWSIDTHMRINYNTLILWYYANVLSNKQQIFPPIDKLTETWTE